MTTTQITEITITIDGTDDTNYAGAMLEALNGVSVNEFDVAALARTEFDQISSHRAEYDMEPITRLDLIVTLSTGLVVERTVAA